MIKTRKGTDIVPEQRRSRFAHVLLEGVGAVAGGTLVVAVATVPLNARDQALFAVVAIVSCLLLNRFTSRVITVLLIMLSVTMTLRYIFWRMTETLSLDSLPELALGSGLLLAELYAGLVLILGYIQNISPLQRQPLPLPEDDTAWPTVDIFIPTYNEPLGVVRAAVLAALGMDWPRDKLKIWLLDDGRREPFKTFAAASGCGYITRSDNAHAKAGNLNNALSQTTGEYIAVFDCDHIPTRSFLQLTMGWLVAEPAMAMVQTPHHFYSPDPFQRNLDSGTRVPPEGNLFYGLAQDGNDYWNACFFCGSCAVLRRSALEEIGGFAVETVTEDAHTMLKLHRRGWESAYLRLPLAAGLATERLRLHIRQRSRWARGMIQILRLDNPLFGSGLTFGQRICYLQASIHFVCALPRVVFLTAPLAFLLAEQSIIAASPLAITAYALPHIVLSTVTNSRQQKNWRHSFWSEIYETVLALFLIPVILITLIAPRRGKFNVTAKGEQLETAYFDGFAVFPNLILAILLLVGLLRGVIGLALFEQEVLVFQALLLNTIWATFSLLTVMAALAVGRETRQVRRHARIPAAIPVTVRLSDDTTFDGISVDLSQSGARLSVDNSGQISDTSQVQVMFLLGEEKIAVQGHVIRASDKLLQLQWHIGTPQDEANLVRVVFGRADAWLSWDAYPADKPLRSLWDILVSIIGLFRRRPREEPQPAVDTAHKQKRQSGATITRSGIVTAMGLVLLSSASAAQPRNIPPATTPAGPAPPVGALTVPAPTPPHAELSTDGRAAAAEVQAGIRTIVVNLRQLGAAGPMTMRGTSELQGVQFGIRADEVVTAAQLSLSGATSPALIPELSNITVTLNELYIGTIPVDPRKPEYQLTMTVNPMYFLTDNNRLNFRFTGRYTRECHDPLSGLLWASVYDTSTLTLRLERLPAQRTLGRLPLPFFDHREQEQLILPFVLPYTSRYETLQAASVVASWFGTYATHRGARFPVLSQPPIEGNAVMFLTGEEVTNSGVGLPPVTGPTLAVLANPNDSFGSLLVIAGRTIAEAEIAATVLAVGSRTLGGVPLAVVRAPELAARAPYDAPNWIPTDRPVKLGELVDSSSLRSFGYVGLLHVPFRTAPDFFTWHNRPFPLNLRIHAPPGPIIDTAPSRLDVSINNTYLETFSLAPEMSQLGYLSRFFGFEDIRSDTTVYIPPYNIFGVNDLEFYFDSRPLARGACVAVPNDLRMSIDPESTIDLSLGHRISRLPNLAFFASSAFPFTRMADLSDTAAVLPDQVSEVEISAFLTLMGRIGAITGYPSTGIAVVRPENAASVGARDLLMIGTLEHLGSAGGLLANAPVRPVGKRLVVSTSHEMRPARRLFGDTMEAERIRAASKISADLTEEWGALVGAENPLHRNRSLVALLATSPQAVEDLVIALTDPELAPLIQGDLTLFTGGRATSYRIGTTFTFGELPLWLWPSWMLGDQPLIVAVLVLVGCIMLTIVFFRASRRSRHSSRATSRAHR